MLQICVHDHCKVSVRCLQSGILAEVSAEGNVGNLRACSGISGSRITGCSEDRVRTRSIGRICLCRILQSRQPADLLQSFIAAAVVYENITEFVSLDGRKRLAGFFPETIQAAFLIVAGYDHINVYYHIIHPS